MNMEETAACAQVSAIEFVAVCGSCDPVPLRVESMETAEGSISSLGAAGSQTDGDATSVLLAVVVTATISLLLGAGGGLKLGMVRGGKSMGGRARTSMSEISIQVSC